MKTINCYTVLILLILSFCCFSETLVSQNIVIKGTVNGDLKGYNEVRMYNNITRENATAIITDGKFEMEIPFSIPTRYMFFLEYTARVHGGYPPFGILVDKPETIYVETNAGDGFHNSTIRGAGAHKVYEQYLQKLNEVRAAVNEKLKEKFGKIPEEDDDVFHVYSLERNELTTAYTSEVTAYFVRKNPDSYASVFILDRHSRDMEIFLIEELFNSLTAELQQTHEGKRVADNIEGLKNSQLGNAVLDFTLPDPDGKPVNIRDYRGKYVLIDFWASWCQPCIASFPHLREIYETYGTQNFEILGISIDSTKDPWLTSLERHQNPWPQVFDDQNISRAGFAVTAIPAMFIIDPDGTIIARQIRSNELDEKLKELFP